MLVQIIYMEVLLERYGSVIKIRNDKLNEYKELHSKVWPGVQEAIKDCNIKNYSIYYKDGFNNGDDFTTVLELQTLINAQD